VVASEVVALEIALSSARVSNWRESRECYPPWKPNMATHVALETFAASGAIADWRSSGHSNVGHHDINAVPFGVSLSPYVPLTCDT